MKIKGLHFCSFDPFEDNIRFRQHNNPFISFPLSSPIAIDVDTATFGNSSYSPTRTITIGNNPNRLLLVKIAWLNSVLAVSDPTSVKLGTTSLTKKISNITITGGNGVGIWYLIAPTTGAGTVTVNFAEASGTQYSMVDVMSLYNVNQSTPFGASNTAVGTSSSASVSITPTNIGAWLVECLNAGTGTPTSPSDTQDQNAVMGSAYSGASQHKTNPTISSSNSLTWALGVTVNWGQAIVEVIQA